MLNKNVDDEKYSAAVFVHLLWNFQWASHCINLFNYI